MSIQYKEISVLVTTTGTAGAATGTADSEPIHGEIVAVKLDYHASAPVTTTVDLDELGGAARKILDKAASNTDVVHYPRVLMQGITGADLTAWYERHVLAGRKVRVTVALSDALTGAVTATLIVKEEH